MRLIASPLARRHHLRIHPGQMPDPHESHMPVDHYEAALEASCDTLITLRLIRASATGPSAEVGGIDGQIARAIRSQRRAIAELRLAKTEPGETPILGFVLGAGVAHLRSVAPLSPHSRPRRTA
jgi:hypothetical protein